MDVFTMYIDLRLDLNFIYVYGCFLFIYGYETRLIVFTLVIRGFCYCECADYVNVRLYVILLYENLDIN
jgi:hypothetical protein